MPLLRSTPAWLLGLALLAPILPARAAERDEAVTADGGTTTEGDTWALPPSLGGTGPEGDRDRQAPVDGGSPSPTAAATGAPPKPKAPGDASTTAAAPLQQAGEPPKSAPPTPPSASGDVPPGPTAEVPPPATPAKTDVPSPSGSASAAKPVPPEVPHPRWSFALSTGLHDVPRGPLDPLDQEFRAYGSVGVGYWIERHFSIDLTAGHYLPRGETDLLLGANQAQLPWKRLIPLDFLPESLNFSIGFAAGVLLSSTGGVRLMFAPSGGIGWRFNRNWSAGLSYTHGLVLDTYTRSRTGLVLTFSP